MSTTYSRRAVLARLGSAGIAAAAAPLGTVRHAFAAEDARPWAFLTDQEARWVAAAADVFIPEDDYPSASQAGVVDYIDFQMATDYGRGKGLYLRPPFPQGTPEQGYQLPFPPAELLSKGIAAHLDEGPALYDLDIPGREGAIKALSDREDMLGEVPAQTFFAELLSLTNEGYFADPIYLGNAQYAGWKMVGFPGAHAYYTERVDDHNRTVKQPPMGIAHGAQGAPTLPRPIPTEG